MNKTKVIAGLVFATVLVGLFYNSGDYQRAYRLLDTAIDNPTEKNVENAQKEYDKAMEHLQQLVERKHTLEDRIKQEQETKDGKIESN